jgi:glycosyltransferase involved in cell wall biosynthesis
MKLSENTTQLLISVIIPCYNRGKYLGKAIESVVSQTYKHYEIVVVDDGSTDSTKSIAESYSFVKYVYQSNQGPSAARNKGIDCSTGNYLIFLDSDDWLLPEALNINLGFLLRNPELAFVSGAHAVFYEDGSKNHEVRTEVIKDNYLSLLESNYIGMIATVLFHRWAFDSIRYDTSLKTCEDYDLYLKIARLYPVMQHTLMIAVYRIHSKNVSGNTIIMLENALFVLNRQKASLRNRKERKAFKNGQILWRSYYSQLIYNDLNLTFYNYHSINKTELIFLKSAQKSLYIKFILKTKLKVPNGLFTYLKMVLKKTFIYSFLKNVKKSN